MFNLYVVEPGRELPVRCHFITQLQHSESRLPLNLVATLSFQVGLEVSPSLDLQAGVVMHRKTGRRYFLNRVVTEYGTDQLGVWYTALYEAVAPPHFFRPLYTADGAGWLNAADDGQPRYQHVTRAEVLLNPEAPDHDMDR